MSVNPIIYYGHHKCASSWINRILWNVTAELGLNFRSFHDDALFEGALPEAIERLALDVVSLRNARWDHTECYPEGIGLHVIRDPRDIIVSAYFSHLKTHRLLSDEMADERERLSKLSKEEGLIAEMSGISERTLRDLDAWQYGKLPGVLEFKMEEFTVHHAEEFPRVLEHFGWFQKGSGDPLGSRFWALANRAHRHSKGWTLLRRRQRAMTEGGLRRILDRLSFRKLSGGRKPGQENASSHYRKGKAGDWQNHFTPEVTAAFKEKYPGLVTKLGYEASEDWE